MTEAENFLKERGFDPAKMHGWELVPQIHDEGKFREWLVNKYATRELYIKKYGFAILSTLAIEAIRPHAPLAQHL